jgi:hypothetical protein
MDVLGDPGDFLPAGIGGSATATEEQLDEIEQDIREGIMQVDEARNNGKPHNMDYSVTLKGYLSDRSYLTSNHPNRAYGVEARFWIDDPPPLNHQIVMGIPNVTAR